MKNKRSDIEVGVGQRPHCIGVRYQFHDDVWWPGVAPHDA